MAGSTSTAAELQFGTAADQKQVRVTPTLVSPRPLMFDEGVAPENAIKAIFAQAQRHELLNQ